MCHGSYIICAVLWPMKSDGDAPAGDESVAFVLCVLSIAGTGSVQTSSHGLPLADSFWSTPGPYPLTHLGTQSHG